MTWLCIRDFLIQSSCTFPASELSVACSNRTVNVWECDVHGLHIPEALKKVTELIAQMTTLGGEISFWLGWKLDLHHHPALISAEADLLMPLSCQRQCNSCAPSALLIQCCCFNCCSALANASQLM